MIDRVISEENTSRAVMETQDKRTLCSICMKEEASMTGARKSIQSEGQRGRKGTLSSMLFPRP